MPHGVWPPLTAMMKRPRPAIAARASAAINLAASWATESASANISIFMKTSPSGLTIHDRVLPASDGGDFGIDFARSPAVRLVFNHRRIRFQYRVDNSPCLFDLALSRKHRRVSRHSVSQHPFISIHFFPGSLSPHHHFHHLPPHILPPTTTLHPDD